MNNPLFNLNTQSPGTVAASATTPNALNKKRKFAGDFSAIRNLVNQPKATTGQEVFQPGGKFYNPNVPQFAQPNRAVTDAQPVNVPQMQQQQVQPQQAQPQQQNTQTNLPFGGVSQLQASPQAFMSFLRQFNRN